MEPLQQIDAVQEQVDEQFSALSSEQLNWKPEPGKWSIAQCLDHIITSNKTYFPAFNKLLRHEYRLSFFQQLNPFKKSLGPMMVRNLGPQVTKKFTTPTVFQPSSSTLPASIVGDFRTHQQELRKYIHQLLQLDTKNLVMASPVTGMITYTLADAIRILTGHEQRHVNQAKQILHHPNFPR
jgi:hypothetical protein